MTNFAKVNKFGVFESNQCKITKGEGQGWRLSIYVAHAGENEYRASFDVNFNHWGSGYAPSLRDKTYKNYDQAFFAMVDELIKRLSEKENTAQAITWLKSKRQMTLFK